MTTQLIDQLIGQAKEAEQEKKAEQDRRQQEIMNQAEQTISQALGELWTVFQQYVTKVSLNGRDVRVQVDGEGMAALELSPFWIHYSQYHDDGVYLHWSEHPGGQLQIVTTPDSLALCNFLAERRQAYVEQQEKKYRERLEHLSYKLGSSSSRATSPEEADVALVQLLELDPDNGEKWRGKRDGWQAEYEDEQERKANLARLDELAAKYQTAYEAYYRRYLAIRQANREVLEKLQGELDTTARVWKLTYGIVAEDGGDRYVDTGHTYVTGPEPAGDGYWITFARYGKLARKWFNHVVSIEGPIVFRPIEDELGIRGQVTHFTENDGRSQVLADVYFNPGVVTLAEVEEMVAMATRPYPEPPPVPDEIMHTGWEHKATCRAIEAVDGSELPY